MVPNFWPCDSDVCSLLDLEGREPEEMAVREEVERDDRVVRAEA